MANHCSSCSSSCTPPSYRYFYKPVKRKCIFEFVPYRLVDAEKSYTNTARIQSKKQQIGNSRQRVFQQDSVNVLHKVQNVRADLLAIFRLAALSYIALPSAIIHVDDNRRQVFGSVPVEFDKPHKPLYGSAICTCIPQNESELANMVWNRLRQKSIWLL